MPRMHNRLTTRTVQTIKDAGRHADGGGLYLFVSAGDRRRWVFRYTRAGETVEMGLGGAGPDGVTLATARAKAAAARDQLARGGDPLTARRQAMPPSTATFGEFADRLVADIAVGFRNEKHRAQWAMTLTTYAAPLRGKPLDAITTDDVLEVLNPIWTTKSETASRLRARIERVLDAARAKGLRSGENPARWRGHLDSLLPRRQKLARGHHAAMPYRDVPTFVARLREVEGMSARALEFCVLAASRSGEVLGARWQEIDLADKVWVVPAGRMKAAREHRVPLTLRMLEILGEVGAGDRGPFVFRGGRRDKPLSVTALQMALRRRQAGKVTVHGFRSAFRDWAAEETPFPREVAEAALAHVVGDATERAYRRGDALEKRRQLMEAWASFLG